MPHSTELHGISRAASAAVVCGIWRMGFTEFALFHLSWPAVNQALDRLQPRRNTFKGWDIGQPLASLWPGLDKLTAEKLA